MWQVPLSYMGRASRKKIHVCFYIYCESESCSVLSDTLCNCIVHGILQARILEWVAFPFSGRSPQPMDRTQVSHIAGEFFTNWATVEAQDYWNG